MGCGWVREKSGQLALAGSEEGDWKRGQYHRYRSPPVMAVDSWRKRFTAEEGHRERRPLAAA